MRHKPIDPKLFVENRRRLAEFLPPNSVAVVNANDLMPANADATLTMQPNSDLFYLTGVEQEESLLLLAPGAADEKLREVLFLREPNEHLKTWEGHKLSKEKATAASGVKTVKWLSEWPAVFHGTMCDAEHVYLNSNEHKRAVVEVQTRDARFVAECRARYPLHQYHRLARLMHRLRAAKSAAELALLREAVAITDKGFRRVARFVRPGVTEYEVEAEFAHEFLRRRARFAYNPIIASGASACVLHYVANDQTCKKGDLLLLDVGASYANYNADLTRTMGLDATPTATLVQRWPRAIPQYVVGHADRLDLLDLLVPSRMHLTGAAFRGSGLAACVAAARRTANDVATDLNGSDHPDHRPDPSLQGATP